MPVEDSQRFAKLTSYEPKQLRKTGFRVKNLNKPITHFKQMQVTIPQALEIAVKRARAVIVLRAKEILREEDHDKTGKLLKSFRLGFAVEGLTARGYIYNTAPYASDVEFGASPHVVKPKNKQVLAWQEAGGEWRFASSTVAYVKAVHYLGRALEQTAPEVRAIFDDVFTRWAVGDLSLSIDTGLEDIAEED